MVIQSHIHLDAVSSLTYKDIEDPSEANILQPVESSNTLSEVSQWSSFPYQIVHRDLGYSHPRSVRVHIKKSFQGQVFNEVHYSFDEHRRRVTPVQDSKDRDVNVLFFGCSFMMGDSLNDNQTIPFYVSEKLPRVRSFNYAIGGMGAPAMLYQIENRDLEYEVGKAKKNIGIYMFADSHVERTVLDAFRSQWLVDVPYYDWDGKKIIDYPSFAHAKPFTFYFYELLGMSRILAPHLEEWAPNLSHQSEKESERQFVEVVKRAKESFEKKLENVEFYVAIFPAANLEQAARLTAMFRKSGIPVIPLQLPDDDFRIHEMESHFNEKANTIMAETLAKEIKL